MPGDLVASEEEEVAGHLSAQGRTESAEEAHEAVLTEDLCGHLYGASAKGASLVQYISPTSEIRQWGSIKNSFLAKSAHSEIRR